MFLRQENLAPMQSLQVPILLTFVVPIATQSTGEQSYLKYEIQKNTFTEQMQDFI